MDNKENKLPTSEEEQAREIFEMLMKKYPLARVRLQIEWDENPSLAHMKKLLEMEPMLF